MADENIGSPPKNSAEWFEVDVPVRGCTFTLKQIQSAYSELNQITQRECERTINDLKKPDDKSDAVWAAELADIRARAFKITVSIKGGEDNVTKYGETGAIFDDSDLPFPIKSIFFTNEHSYKNVSNGISPPNGFLVWINFEKPPLFDPNPLVSHPTINASNVKIKARDLTYFRATQNVFNTQIKRTRHWYSFIHEKFAYDIGLWLIGAPYTLYTVTIYCDKFFPAGGNLASFRVAFYIYGIFVGIMIYRMLYSYLKWAFPVNVLKENKDTATRHRLFFATIITSLVVHFVSRVIWP